MDSTLPFSIDLCVGFKSSLAQPSLWAYSIKRQIQPTFDESKRDHELIEDVPILVETLSRPFFPMVRCFYIALDFDTPDNGWSLGLGGRPYPFLMLGLTGIVQVPFGADRFRLPHLIDDLIETVENANGLVSFEDIWLPQELFDLNVAIGEVYRVSVVLFRSAFRFRDSRSTREQFEQESREFHNQISISEEETNAFRVWSAATISRTRSDGPKDRRLQLERKRER
jgi:hypothetical protein